jgi:alpha-tubulin suppressor-like RCC1 family protein
MTDLVLPLGRVFSFGLERHGCLGHDSTESQALPKEIEALRGVDVVSVSAGGRHALALTYTGGVYSWGADPRILGHGTPFGVDTGMIGLIKELPRRIEALRGVRVRCVAAGRQHSCAVTDEGHVYTWGRGRTGALGHFEFENEPLPKRVEMLYGNGICAVGVAAGGDHTLVAISGGAVWGFGSLNAIGAWNDPFVEAMRDARALAEDEEEGEGEDSVSDDYYFFGSPEGYYNGPPSIMDDTSNFLFPHGRASSSMPLRIPVEVLV